MYANARTASRTAPILRDAETRIRPGRTVMAAKRLLFADHARAEMLEGVGVLAGTVRATLGPRGRNVMIENSHGVPTVTRDGATLARCITLDDEFRNIGAQLVKEVAAQMAEDVGDGTTTAIVLVEAIFREGLKAVTAGVDSTALKRGIDRAAAAAVARLKQIAVPCKDTKTIAQVGAISANSDESIGRTLARAIEAVGKEGVITVEEGQSVDDRLKIVEGMQFDSGFLSPWFISDPETMTAALHRPHILLCNQRIQGGRDLIPLLEAVARTGKSLLVIADDVSGGSLTLLVMNSLRGTVKSAAVKAPGVGDQRREMLEDIAVATGGRVVSGDVGLALGQVTLEDLGSARRVRVSKGATTLVDGGGDKCTVERRVAMLRDQLEESKSAHERARIEQRIANLSGGIAIIEVGAASEVALKERKSRYEDALFATHAAIQEGIVPGGGVALIRVREAIEATRTDCPDESAGIRILLRAVEEPLRQIVRNGGGDPSVVLSTIVGGTGNFGFNAATEEFGDLIKLGIIDPVKVTRLALQNAVSIAGLLLATQAAVAAIHVKKRPAK